MRQEREKFEGESAKQISALREDNLQILEHYNKSQAELEDKEREVLLIFLFLFCIL